MICNKTLEVVNLNCSLPPENLNEKLLKGIKFIRDSDRKIVRLIERQHTVVGLNQEGRLLHIHYMNTEGKLFIKTTTL
jgi:hypothetical protein